MDGIGNLLGGLLTGFTQTVQQQRERQVQDEYKKALIEQSKLQTKQLENKLKLAEQEAGMKNAFFQNVLGPLMGGGGQMPMAPPQGPLPAEGFQPAVGPYGSAAPPAPTPGSVSAMPQPKATGGGYFADLVNEASQKYGVNPWLIEAVIKNESGGNPRAVSPKGAQGLMQLMPGTAQGLGVTDPFDPRQNIMGGVNYLKQQIDRFGGDIPKAIAAYNAGPGAVEKHGGIPPYAETRQFVKNVMAGAPAQPQPMQGRPPAGRMSMENMSPEQRFAVDIGGMMILDKDLGLRKEKGFAGTVDLGDSIGLLDKQGNVSRLIPKTVKPEAFETELPTGEKRRFFYDPFKPPQGLPLQSGGIAPEKAGKLNLAANAFTRLQEVQGMVFPGGKLDRALLAKAAVPGGGIGQGSQLYSKMYQAIDGALRLETGAQATPHEITTKMHEFWPSVKDTEETIRVKLKDFREYVDGVVSISDPTGEIRKMRKKPSLGLGQQGQGVKWRYNPQTGKLEPMQ